MLHPGLDKSSAASDTEIFQRPSDMVPSEVMSIG
jgi:hypothetical protein